MNTPEIDPERVITNTVMDRLPDTPPSTIRDLQYLYGVLYTAHQVKQLGTSDDLALYLTPDAASDALNNPDTVVSVDVDVSGSTPSYEGITVTSYSEDMITDIGHSWYYARKGMDFSVTHRTGKSTTPSKVGEYASERLTKWPVDDAVQQATESHTQSHLIDALVTLGEDESVIESIQQSVAQKLSGKKQRLVTIRLKGVPGAGVSEWVYPGTIPVFQDAMKARRETVLYDKNEADNARGDGTCYITGEETEVYGAAADPLKLYLTKQRESFPGFDSDLSWQTHGLSSNAALYAEKSEEYLEACRYTSAGLSIYVLPYFTGSQSLQKVRALYNLLATQLREVQTQEASDSDDGRRTPAHIQDAYKSLSEDYREQLNFHVIAVHKYQADKWRVMLTGFETPLLSVVELGTAHQTVLERIETSSSTPFPLEQEPGMLHPSSDKLSLVSTPWYFMQTLTEKDGKDDPSADDAVFTAYEDVLNRNEIPVETLITEYANRVVTDWDHSQDTGGVPQWTLAKQYTQLVALSETGLLTATTDAGESLTTYYDDTNTTTDTMTTNSLTDDSESDTRTRTERRRDNYTEFIDSHPPLRDNAERRASFLLGALIGEVSRYQHQQGTSPLAKSHTAKTITKHNLSRITTEVMDLVAVYSKDSDVSMAGTMYSELTTRLVNAVQHTPPEDWSLSLEDIRLHYSLGVNYGLNNYTGATNTNDTNDTNEETE